MVEIIGLVELPMVELSSGDCTTKEKTLYLCNILYPTFCSNIKCMAQKTLLSLRYK